MADTLVYDIPGGILPAYDASGAPQPGFYSFRGNAHASANALRRGMEALASCWEASYANGHSPVAYTPEAIDRLVDKTSAHNRHANRRSGNRYNEMRPRQRPRKGRGGNGFSYRPEIPYQRAGTGSGHPRMDDFSGDGEPGLYDADDARPRYERRPGHPQQTVPKIEWAVVRGWANQLKQKRKAALPRAGVRAAQREALAGIRYDVTHDLEKAFHRGAHNPYKGEQKNP